MMSRTTPFSRFVRDTKSLSRCSIVALALLGCAPSMRDTAAPATPRTFDNLEASAKKLGWKTERAENGASDGIYFYYLRVTTDTGGKVYFTKNNSRGKVAFTCEGLDDAECDVAGIRLFVTRR